MGRKKRADITASSFKHRLLLVSTAKGVSLNKIHKMAGVNPRHTRDIINRGKPPTYSLLKRLLTPQGLSIACFVGDIKNLVMILKKEI